MTDNIINVLIKTTNKVIYRIFNINKILATIIKLNERDFMVNNIIKYKYIIES